MSSVNTIDLRHLGFPGRIAAYLVVGHDGPILIETGPHSCHQALLDGLADHGFEPRDIKNIFVTHIHLDHAGAAGWWARHGATVHVHPVGAPHLVDPGKLVTSATRLYGDRMDRLWGEILPAPKSQIRVVHDGEIVRVAGLDVEVLDTPGHASHHHAYRIADVVFTGDLAAIVVPDTNLIELPTVPPEFDVKLWQASIDRVRRLEPSVIFPTHFGPIEGVDGHFSAVTHLLGTTTSLVREALEAGSSRDEIAASFADWNRERLIEAGASDDDLRHLLDFNPPSVSLAGILRYWKKKAGLVPTPE